MPNSSRKGDFSSSRENDKVKGPETQGTGGKALHPGREIRQGTYDTPLPNTSGGKALERAIQRYESGERESQPKADLPSHQQDRTEIATGTERKYNSSEVQQYSRYDKITEIMFSKYKNKESAPANYTPKELNLINP